VERVDRLTVLPPSTCLLPPAVRLIGPLGLRSSSAKRVRSKVGPGFEFLCEAQIHSIVERVARMGEGRSEGANSPVKADIHPVAERHLRMGGGRSEGANPGPP
jgi:hypothetical protein